MLPVVDGVFPLLFLVARLHVEDEQMMKNRSHIIAPAKLAKPVWSPAVVRYTRVFHREFFNKTISHNWWPSSTKRQGFIIRDRIRMKADHPLWRPRRSQCCRIESSPLHHAELAKVSKRSHCACYRRCRHCRGHTFHSGVRSADLMCWV